MKYEDFIDLNYKPSPDDLIALFRVEPIRSYSVLDTAARIAAESSTGTWSELRVSNFVREISAKVFDVNGKWVKIAYPIDLFEEANMVEILSSIAGNLFGMKAVKNVRLEDVTWPIKIKKWFPGPSQGIQGVRNILKIFDRPITATVPKPKVGLVLDEYLRTAEEIWRGGIDLVKDDENLTSQNFIRFSERVKRMFRLRDKIEKETGEKKGYLVNISGPYQTMAKRAKEVIDNGGEFVMIDVLTVGFSAVQSFIEEMRDYNIAIHAHRAFHAAFTRNPKHGMSMKVVAEIFRILGVDHIHVGTIVGKLHGTVREVEALIHICRDSIVKPRKKDRILLNDWDDIKPIFPVSSGGLHPGLLPYILEKFGNDVIIQVGGGVMGHPDGVINGARAVRSVIEGLRDGLSLKEIARKERSVEKALELWGTETPI